MPTVKLIQTGGTIDKQYKMSDGSLYFTQSNLPSMLKQGRSRVDINFHTLELLDSVDISDDYRQQLVDVCKKSSDELIIIAHGTDTMVQSAQQIAQQVSDKTIVLFGAMIPFSINFSDALFNLGGALTAVQTLEKGVYVVMNGQVFNSDNVIKNRELGEFQTL